MIQFNIKQALLWLLLFCSTSLMAQETVTGTVRDEAGVPLIGATIIVKEFPGTGGISDIQGNYSILVPGGGKTLIISFVGTSTIEVSINGRSVVDVILRQDILLEDVVVVGYGVQKRSDITGAVTSIKLDDVKGINIKSIDQSLQGRVAGLNFIQNSGMPGAGSSIRIRGGNSISGGNEPLYVIDGVPVYESPSSTGNSLSGLNSISTSDIESIEVLKDASATAIYGSRGGNGVIMITTRNGKEGKSSIRFSSSLTMQSIRNPYKLLDAAQYEKMSNEALTNEGEAPFYDESLIPPTTNWQDLAIRNALATNNDLSISGGTATSKYLVSLNYLDQNGIITGSDMDKFSLRTNLQQEVSDGIQLGTFLNVSKVNTNRVSSSVYNGMLTAAPNIPVYQPDGSYTKSYIYQGNLTDFVNPVAFMNEFVDYNQSFRFLGNMFLKFKLSEHLSFKVMGGFDAKNSKRDYYNPMVTTSGSKVGGSADISSSKSEMWINENTLDYNREEGDHKIGALLGYTMQGSIYESLSASAQGFSNDLLQMNDLGSGLSPQSPSSSVSQWRLESYIGRLNYGYQDKYLTTLTARADGSSRFGKNNRYGFFPSAAFAWRANQEDFIKNLGVFNTLKFRLSWGLTGNQDGIGSYPGVATMADVTYSFNGYKVPGMLISQPSNDDLKWESTAQTNLGIEMGFFRNRLLFITDVYQKNTNDLLLYVTIPASSGFTSSLQNIGSIKNTGVEFTLKATPVDRGLSWDIDFNIAFNRNEITELGGQELVVPSDAAPNSSNILMVGESLGTFFGYRTQGTFDTWDEIRNSAQPNARPGDVRFVNKEGTSDIINEDDRFIIGNAQPIFFGGFSNNFSYKNIDLSLFFRYSYGNELYNLNTFTLQDLTGKRNNTTEVLNRWTPDNIYTDIPRASSTKTTNIATDREVEDASYIRLKSIQLGYNWKPVSLNKYFTSAYFYLSGENLLTFTKYSGYDPEVSSYGSNVKMGYDSSMYPSLKSLRLGINVSF